MQLSRDEVLRYPHTIKIRCVFQANYSEPCARMIYIDNSQSHDV